MNQYSLFGEMAQVWRKLDKQMVRINAKSPVLGKFVGWKGWKHYSNCVYRRTYILYIVVY